MPDILTSLADWTVHLMDVIGAPGAGVAIALENLFPPLPSEVVLPMAGLAASRGSFTLVEALAWTTLGSVVGAFALYALGARLGVDRLRRLADRLPLLQASDVDRSVAWFERHGEIAVLLGRMLPVFRSLISIPAGTARMRPLRFGLLTAAGSLVWNTVLVVAGYLLGESWHVVETYTGVLQLVVLAAVAAALTWFVVTRVRARHRPTPETPDTPETSGGAGEARGAAGALLGGVGDRRGVQEAARVGVLRGAEDA